MTEPTTSPETEKVQRKCLHESHVMLRNKKKRLKTLILYSVTYTVDSFASYTSVPSLLLASAYYGYISEITLHTYTCTHAERDMG
jgi:hypothetical protein